MSSLFIDELSDQNNQFFTFSNSTNTVLKEHFQLFTNEVEVLCRAHM